MVCTSTADYNEQRSHEKGDEQDVVRRRPFPNLLWICDLVLGVSRGFGVYSFEDGLELYLLATSMAVDQLHLWGLLMVGVDINEKY